MPKPWRLTRQAETSIIHIAKWTIENFGQRQAEAYRNELIAGCNSIANGTILSRACSILIDAALDENIRFARIGQHFVVYWETATEIIVLDFLHVRSDLPSKITYLSETLPN